MAWTIDKTIEGTYGHRVWLQELNEEFAQTTHCKCRFLHGHTLKVKIFMESDTLSSGMVTDFNHLAWMKQFVDDYIDHKFFLDKSDPLFNKFVPEDVELLPVYIKGVKAPLGHVVNIEGMADLDKEWLGSFFIIDFAPTSECLSKWIFDFASEKMKELAIVTRVDWHETPKSRASYTGEPAIK